ncbi:hypothetical protein PO124_22095 [Bacillus licheniformis]|nr:hypothetical protein [Bacillus licheniformis]
MDEYRIPWFNPGFFNKWEIYECLQQDERTAELLPFRHWSPMPINRRHDRPIRLHLCKARRRQFRQRHIPAFKTGRKRYSCQTCRRRHIFSSAAECLKEWQMLHKHTSYLAQQGIERIEVDHHPADFRVHTNKTERSMDRHSHRGQIAGKDGITTHMSSGGAVKHLQRFMMILRKGFTLCKADKAAVLLSRVLDESLTVSSEKSALTWDWTVRERCGCLKPTPGPAEESSPIPVWHLSAA